MEVENNININRTVAYKIALAQFLLSSVIAILLLSVIDVLAAYSAFLAGAISASATLLMAVIMFAKFATSPKQILLFFYLAEMAKLFFTVLVFCIVFLLFNLNIMVFILTYIATIFINWIALIFVT